MRERKWYIALRWCVWGALAVSTVALQLLYARLSGKPSAFLVPNED